MLLLALSFLQQLLLAIADLSLPRHHTMEFPASALAICLHAPLYGSALQLPHSCAPLIQLSRPALCLLLFWL